MSDENDYAPGWRPSVGDEIEGNVVALDARERNRPKPGETHYPILTIEEADGTQTSVHCFHSVLERELKENFRPTEIIGAHIKIRYEGEKTTRDGESTYHLYKVYGGTRRVAAVAASLNWTDDAPEGVRASASVSGGGSSARATAEPPIAPADLGPVPPAPTSQERAAENFGSKAPF
jgi:hypothetical protein